MGVYEVPFQRSTFPLVDGCFTDKANALCYCRGNLAYPCIRRLGIDKFRIRWRRCKARARSGTRMIFPTEWCFLHRACELELSGACPKKVSYSTDYLVM